MRSIDFGIHRLFVSPLIEAHLLNKTGQMDIFYLFDSNESLPGSLHERLMIEHETLKALSQ